MVDPLLRKGSVLLRRRDGEPLRLSREASDDSEHQALVAAMRLLAGAASAKGRVGDKDLQARLPWTRFLPEADRRTFLAEFMANLEACADLGEFAALGRLVENWRATAALHADGTARHLRAPIKEVGARVRRP